MMEFPTPSAGQPPPSQAPGPLLLQGDIGKVLDACLEQTAEALVFCRAASQIDVSHAIDAVRKAHAEDHPLDLVEAVARVQGHQEEHLGGIMRALGDRLAARNMLGAQLALQYGSWTVTAYGTNLTNQHYVAAIFAPAGTNLDLAGPPRQYGIKVLKVF